MITAEMVKELRQRTQAGMMDCKKALIETDGDMDKAVEYLREKGLATAAKKQSRIASEGIVDAYIHGNGRIGVLLEVNCETDFVAMNEKFKSFVRDIALHIAASNPQYIAPEDVPAEVIEKEKAILKAQAMNEGKPEKIAEIAKFYEDVCLLEQAFIKDPDKKVRDVLMEMTATIGEKLSIRRFTRYERGEGLQKKEENFADEVMKQIK